MSSDRIMVVEIGHVLADLDSLPRLMEMDACAIMVENLDAGDPYWNSKIWDS